MRGWRKLRPAALKTHPRDPIALLSALYLSLLRSDEKCQAFRSLLALYPSALFGGEPKEAARVRCALNALVRSWLGTKTARLSAAQVLLWRAILIDGRVGGIAPFGGAGIH
jgi:hypothetical protein